MKIKKLIINIILLMLTISSFFARPEFNSFEEWCQMRHVETPRFKDTFKYIAKRDTESLLYNHVNGKEKVSIKANTEVIVNCNPLSGEGILLPRANYGFLANYNNDQFIWSMKDFAIEGKTWIPNNITDNKWVMKYHYDVLKSKNRNTLSNYEWWIDIFDEKLKKSFYVGGDIEDEQIQDWWEMCIFPPEIVLSDCCIHIDGFFHFYQASGYVLDKNKNKLKIKWISATYEYAFIDAFDSIMDGQESTIEYYLDGDYLTIYIDGNKIELAKKCNDFDSQWESLIQNNNCNLSKIVWPHHADGTSEYEDTIRYPEPVVIEELEEIEVVENREEEPEKEIPPFPDEDDPNYLEIIKKYYPNLYEDQLEHFKYVNKMKKIRTVCISAVSIIILAIIFIILKKKKKSAK